MLKEKKGSAPITKEHTITSLEIAQITGKRHTELLRSIRNQEVGWEKVTERKFAFSEYTDPTGRKLPMYRLTKTESLYIAAKFNDEMRARLVLRWHDLETGATTKAAAPPTLEEVRKAVRTRRIDNQLVYHYRQTLRKLGRSTSSSLNNVRRRFANQVVILDGVGYVGEKYVKVLLARDLARCRASEAEKAKALLSPRFNEPITLWP